MRADRLAYSLDGACTNWAEEYFSRFRRAEINIHITPAVISSDTRKYPHGGKITAAVEWRSGEPLCRSGNEAR
jgi:hypothetical protein